jgi:hypothetical protein
LTRSATRGALYTFHQEMGRTDLLFGEAAHLLDNAGHHELAIGRRDDLVGRNVLFGRWTFQVVEEFDRTYCDVAGAWTDRVHDALLGGRRHVFESEVKDRRRTAGRAGHERRPGDQT